jgi:hypothetical protein
MRLLVTWWQTRVDSAALRMRGRVVLDLPYEVSEPTLARIAEGIG